MKVRDIEGERSMEIIGGTLAHPDSVFLTTGTFAIEFDRGLLIDALKIELGLSEPFEVEVERLLESA